MTRVTWSVPRGTFVGDRLDVSSLVLLARVVRRARSTAHGPVFGLDVRAPSFVRSFVHSIASFVVDALGVRRPHAGPRKPPPAWDETTTTTMGRDSVRAINSTCPPSGFRAHTGRRARRVCVGTSCINVGNERNERNDDASRSRLRRLVSTPSLTARK